MDATALMRFFKKRCNRSTVYDFMESKTSWTLNLRYKRTVKETSVEMKSLKRLLDEFPDINTLKITTGGKKSINLRVFYTLILQLAFILYEDKELIVLMPSIYAYSDSELNSLSIQNRCFCYKSAKIRYHHAPIVMTPIFMLLDIFPTSLVKHARYSSEFSFVYDVVSRYNDSEIECSVSEEYRIPEDWPFRHSLDLSCPFEDDRPDGYSLFDLYNTYKKWRKLVNSRSVMKLFRKGRWSK